MRADVLTIVLSAGAPTGHPYNSLPGIQCETSSSIFGVDPLQVSICICIAGCISVVCPSCKGLGVVISCSPCHHSCYVALYTWFVDSVIGNSLL